jgi:hypothetical protein
MNSLNRKLLETSVELTSSEIYYNYWGYGLAIFFVVIIIIFAGFFLWYATSPSDHYHYDEEYYYRDPYHEPPHEHWDKYNQHSSHHHPPSFGKRYESKFNKKTASKSLSDLLTEYEHEINSV